MDELEKYSILEQLFAPKKLSALEKPFVLDLFNIFFITKYFFKNDLQYILKIV